ncbi:MAG TPA: TolC family protein [Deltaproteobacteria bacterium]|nr:TolC family protein [Deltaproteobacteria bacterium]
MILAGWGAVLTWAQPGRPVTYAEALAASVANNLSVATATASRDQAEGSLLSANGIYDPLYTIEASTNRSKVQGFLQGFPFSSESRSWSLSNNLSTTLGTGTTFSANLGIEHNFSETITNLFGVQDTRLQDTFTSNANLSVTQQLLRGVRFRYNVQNVTQARTGLELAELELEKQRQEALYTAAEAYWSWAYQHELHQIALGSVEVSLEALRVGRLQVESGQLAPVEATRLEAALVQARQNALDAGNLSEQAANVVLLAMGQDPGVSVLPSTLPGDVPDVLDLDAARAVEVALAQNLDLAVSTRNLEQSKLDVDNARHGLLPSLSVTGSTGVASQRCPPGTGGGLDCPETSALGSLGGLLADDNQPFMTLSGQFSVPLGNRSARGERDRVEGLLWQREQELAALQRQISAQVEEQVRALKSANQRMELADANRRLAEETLAAEEALAAAGRTLQKDVLEARTEVDRARAEAAKARTDYRLAQALLLKLQGQLSEQRP